MIKDSIYDIRFAQLDEYDSLHDFMSKYWGENHILTKSKALFDFQHKGIDKYNIVVGYNKTTNEIDGIWSLIPVSTYDQLLNCEGDYWGAILKVRDDVDNKEIKRLPFKLLSFIIKLPGFNTIGFSGLGSKGQPFVNPLCNVHGVLNQYYIANPYKDFVIGKNLLKKDFVASDFSVKTIKIGDLDWAPQNCYTPKKTVKFLINRFEKHPVYKYGFWGVFKNDDLKAVLVYRVVDVKGKGRVIRIVDVLGMLEEIGDVGYEFVKILKEFDAEYIDCLNFGIATSVFTRMGFEQLDNSKDSIIVPNYFEPFEQCNVQVHFAFISKSPYVIFRADADQDRPSVL